jgi:hypothetical protein
MARSFISPNNATNKTIDAIDRKREKERRFLLTHARDNAAELATKLTQRLLDEHIVETTSDRAIRETLENQLHQMISIDEFDMQYKISPIRSIVPNPSITSLYITQYIIEDMINHPKVQDIFGDDLDVYRVVDSVLSKVRPK